MVTNRIPLSRILISSCQHKAVLSHRHLSFLPLPCTYSLACSGCAWGAQALLLLCCQGPKLAAQLR